MSFQTHLIVVGLGLFTLRAGAQVVELSPSSTLKMAFDNEAAQERIRSQYFYRERAEHRRAGAGDQPGKLNFNHNYEWVYLEGEPFRRLVAINEAPLKGKQAAEEERRLRMTGTERRATASQNRERSKAVSFGDVELAVIWRVMEHTLLREELPGGRTTWLIQSEAKVGVAPNSAEERRALCYRYTFWVDAQDLAISQKKYEVVREGVDTLPGSWSTTAFHRHSAGLWFPERIIGYYVTGPPRPSQWFQSHRFFDFRKFDSESTIVFPELRP